jgi:hypothetical protein
MKKISLFTLLLFHLLTGFSQGIDKIIKKKETERILKILAADEMQGRKIFTPSIDKAADFIATEFKKNNLQPFPELDSYKQSFTVVKASLLSAEAIINDSLVIDPRNIEVFSSKTALSVNQTSGYTRIRLNRSADMLQEARELLQTKINYIVFVDTSFKPEFTNLKRFRSESFRRTNNIIFIRTSLEANTFQLNIKQEITERPLSNVAGMLLGKSKPNEFVIFSAHYDHLGIGKPNEALDSIYNGANDDASGVTALILLANYFSKLNNNQRSILFVAFTAEETGGLGSAYFSTQINPEKVMAMFNIEMIGTGSKWGRNSAYITGYEKSDLGKILQQNLAGTVFRFEPDPYPQQKLFYRSDNARLAELGVPAHSISTSKMDEEKYYHSTEDEIETLDLENMTAVIKAIATSSSTIISGKDSPSRIEEK